MNFDPNIANMMAQYEGIDIPIEHKLREILQQSALLGLSRQQFFEHAAFYGGTALRILYGLDRFSEDLDFSLIVPNAQFDLHPFLEGLHEEMTALGFQVKISEKKKTNHSESLSAFLKTNTLNLTLQMKRRMRSDLHPEQKIRIKLEIDTHPPPNFQLEPKLILNPIPFYVITLREEDLFAGKLHAVLCRGWKNRVKGRDWYDFLWFIRRGTAVHLEHLVQRMRQTSHLGQNENLDLKNLKLRLRKRIEKIDWEHAKADVSPFVLDSSLLENWSASFFLELLDHLKSL